MNQDQQIDLLNSQIKATVGVSKIHGVGVIAIRAIAKGEMVYANALPKLCKIPYGSINKLFPEVRKIILDRWPLVVNGGAIVAHDVRLLSLMNHSSTPNYDPLTDEALEDIPAGVEITENYKSMVNYAKVWPLEKNLWLTVSNAEKSKSQKNTLVARFAKHLIKSFAKS